MYNKNNFLIHELSNKDNLPLSGVYFTQNKTVATDSYSLMEVTTPADQDINDFPLLDNSTTPQLLDNKIIPADSIKKVLKNIKTNKELPILENVVTIYDSENNIAKFITNDLSTEDVIKTKIIDAEYPDYEKIIPNTNDKKPIKVNVKYLKRLISIIDKMNPTDETINIYVNTDTDTDTTPIVFTATTKQKQDIKALLMPIK